MTRKQWFDRLYELVDEDLVVREYTVLVKLYQNGESVEWAAEFVQSLDCGDANYGYD